MFLFEHYSTHASHPRGFYRIEAAPTHWLVGFFQPEQGQIGCISCDSLGDYFQELPGLTFCHQCPSSTQRYLGVLSGANRSACQCKEGAISATSPQSLVCAWNLCASVSTERSIAGYHNTRLEAGEVCCSRHTIDRFLSLPATNTRLASGFAGVCEMYEGARACAGCFAVGCTHSACLKWSRPFAREQVQSAFHVLAG